MIVLDTNVLGELVRANPDPNVADWLSRRRRSELCTTAVTEAELAYGLTLMPKSRRRDALVHAVARLLADRLGGRVLPFDRAAAVAHGSFAASRRVAGRPVAISDAQIAAIARARGAALLATRDVAGLHGCGVALADPWGAGAT